MKQESYQKCICREGIPCIDISNKIGKPSGNDGKDPQRIWYWENRIRLLQDPFLPLSQVLRFSIVFFNQIKGKYIAYMCIYCIHVCSIDQFMYLPVYWLSQPVLVSISQNSTNYFKLQSENLCRMLKMGLIPGFWAASQIFGCWFSSELRQEFRLKALEIVQSKFLFQ